MALIYTDTMRLSTTVHILRLPKLAYFTTCRVVVLPLKGPRYYYRAIGKVSSVCTLYFSSQVGLHTHKEEEEEEREEKRSCTVGSPTSRRRWRRRLAGDFFFSLILAGTRVTLCRTEIQLSLSHFFHVTPIVGRVANK
jgi:hypothetical protein